RDGHPPRPGPVAHREGDGPRHAARRLRRRAGPGLRDSGGCPSPPGGYRPKNGGGRRGKGPGGHTRRPLPGALASVGRAPLRLLTDVYQDTTLTPYTKTFLERRAERAVTWSIVDAAAAQRWLDGFTALVAAGGFVMTMNYYGAVGEKPSTND